MSMAGSMHEHVRMTEEEFVEMVMTTWREGRMSAFKVADELDLPEFLVSRIIREHTTQEELDEIMKEWDDIEEHYRKIREGA